MKGKLKDKLLSVLFLAIAVGITYYVYTDAKNTREEISIPVISNDIKFGEIIETSDIGTTTVGKYKLDSNIITNKEDIVGKYATKDMYKGRFYYKQDIDVEKPPTEVRDKIEQGAMAIETDLVKCVGGIPREGDYVKINIIKKGDSSTPTEVIQYAELARLKILDIKNNNSESIAKDERDNSAMGNVSSSQTKPDLVIFEVNQEQEVKLLIGQYTGDLHLTLLPKEVDELASITAVDVIVESEIDAPTIEDPADTTTIIESETKSEIDSKTSTGDKKEVKDPNDDGSNNKPKVLVPNVPKTETEQPPVGGEIIIIEESEDFEINP